MMFLRRCRSSNSNSSCSLLKLFLLLVIVLSCLGTTYSSSNAEAEAAATATATEDNDNNNNNNNDNDDNDNDKVMKSRIRGAFYGLMVADAMCLGSHLEYNSTKIREHFDADQFMQETIAFSSGRTKRKVHPKTGPGDLTDYGEYNMVTLEWLVKLATTGSSSGSSSSDDNPAAAAAASPPPPPPFIKNQAFIDYWKKQVFGNRWKQRVSDSSKYFIRQIMMEFPLDEITPSDSNSMGVRSAALLGYSALEQEVVQGAKTVFFTHGDAEGQWAVEFVTRVAFRLVHATEEERYDQRDNFMEFTMETVADDMDVDWVHNMLDHAMQKVYESTHTAPLKDEPVESRNTMALMSMGSAWNGQYQQRSRLERYANKYEEIPEGLDSPAGSTLPGALYFILKYYHITDADGIELAMMENAKVGGDSASRAVVIGMLMGAYSGEDAIPKKWLHQVNHYQSAKKLLKQLPLLQGDDDDDDDDDTDDTDDTPTDEDTVSSGKDEL